jgi:hypothetical protein
MLEVNLNIFLKNSFNFLCKLRYFYAFANYSIAAWFLVIISIDQFMSISFSKKFTFRNKTKFQLCLSSFIIIFNLFFYSPIWFYFSIHKTEKFINNNKSKESNHTIIIRNNCESKDIWFPWYNLFQSVVIPFNLMALFTILSIRTVFKSRRKAKTNKTSKDIRFAITSIVNILIFLLMNLPLKLYVLINDYTSLLDNLDSNLYISIETICHVFLYSNLITSFFITYLLNSIFKSEFKILFSSKCLCRKNLIIPDNSSI